MLLSVFGDTGGWRLSGKNERKDEEALAKEEVAVGECFVCLFERAASGVRPPARRH